jgi:hypothetical protein
MEGRKERRKEGKKEGREGDWNVTEVFIQNTSLLILGGLSFHSLGILKNKNLISHRMETGNPKSPC